MHYELFMSNINFLLRGEKSKRVEVNESEDGRVCIDLDLHGLSRNEGKVLVKNVININKGEEFVINAIHGYNHGTVLKQMIMEEKWSSRVIARESPAWNPGQTFLTIAA